MVIALVMEKVAKVRDDQRMMSMEETLNASYVIRRILATPPYILT